MIPSFMRRLSSRLSLTRKPSEKKEDETDGRPSLSRRSTKELSRKDSDKDVRPESSSLKKRSTIDKTPLSKRPTIQLNSEDSTSRRPSRQVTFQKSLSKKSSSTGSSDKNPLTPSRSLSKKLSSAGRTTSLTSKPILAGRAPSLTAHASKESMTKKISVTGPVRKKKDKNEKTLWYLSGIYVTVRNDDGGWFLCRLQHNVYNTTKSVKIRWLSRKSSSPMNQNEYVLDYRDEIDPGCILFNVRVTRDRTTYTLYDEDRLETEKLLKVAADVASGMMTYEDVESDVEEVVQIEPPPPKKRKTEGKTKTGSKDKKSKGSKVKKTPGEKKKREPKEKTKKEKKEPKRKVSKKVDEITLHPNPAVKILKKDPFFQTSESVPFISKYAHSRLVFRAVEQKDYKLLKKLFKETEKVRNLDHWRSVADQTTALSDAIKLKDKEAMKLLIKDYFAGHKDNARDKRLKDSQADKINVAKLDTGSYNFRSLGVAYIRPIMASRGSREGNNALTKDLQDMREQKNPTLEDHLAYMMKYGMDYVTMKEVLAVLNVNDDNSLNYGHYMQFLRVLDIALERGHNKLAGNFMKDISENQPRLAKMSNLHYTVLISDKELKNAPPSQVSWGMKSCNMITPVHCAACNPDTQYLERLLKVEPDIHISDKLNRRPIHFAAGCSGTGPLELLVKRGANIYDCDRQGRIPLHWAVAANRVDNVQFLLTTATKNRVGAEDPLLAKYGVGGVNRPNKNSYSPLHIATEAGCIDMVKILVKNGAIVNATLNTSRFKVTPLMMAAQFGYYDIVVFLIENGAVAQQKDRLGRTALIHAAMNGNTNVLSYLLNIGANPKLPDNSGNSPLHYAAAYGWYFCVRTLLEAGADVNVGNDWKTTPLSIAYMKGHTGIVHFILTESDVDVNFQDDEGMTLVSTAASSALYPDLYDQMHYLIKDKGALCTFKDVEDSTPLHHLAKNDILLEGTQLFATPSDEAMETSVKIAKLLIDNGCDHKAVNKKGVTAVMTAMRTGNLKLVKYLVQAGCPVITELDKEGDNIFHHLCYDHMDTMKDYLAILKYAAKQDGRSGMQNLKKNFNDMAKVYCHDGSIPLLAACQQYSVCKHSCSTTAAEEDKACARLLWKRGRDFIQFLIDEFDSDVNAVIREKYYENEEDKPKKEQDRYQADWGKWSVAEMIADVEHCEYAALREEKEVEWPALRMILKYKPNMNTRDCEGHTALTGAVDYSKIVPATLLVKESNADVNAYYIKEENGKKYKIWTVVIAALTANQTLLDLIVEAGADLNVIDERDGSKPLHAAIIKGDKADGTLKMMRTLLDHGADVDVLNKKKRTPLHLAVDYNAGNMNDNFDLVLALINKGADLTITDIRGRTPLHYVFVKTGKHTVSSQHDPVELCRLIASRMKPKDLNTQDKFGMTALHRAAFRGANICCMYLMQRGADVNLKDNDGNTALTMAAKGHHDGCATVLIQNGACLKDPVVEVTTDTTSRDDSDDEDDEKSDADDVDIDMEAAKKKKAVEKLRPVWKWAPQRKEEKDDSVKKIPLFEYAIQHEFQGVCFLVMEKPVKESGITFADAIEIGLKLQKYNIVLRLLTTTADVSSLQKDREHGRNLLHMLSLTATYNNNLVEKVVKQLVEKKVSLTKQDEYKCTPLLYASLNRNYELCKFYIKTPGVYNPKYTDSFNRSVLAAAFWKTSKSYDSDLTWWVHELVEKKANLNEVIDRPLPECLFGATDKVDDPDYWKAYDTVKISALIIAIHHHNQFFTQWVLKKGANVNCPDSVGRTPMMHAVRVNDLHLVKTLMNFEFDPNAKEEDENKTPDKELTKKKMQSRIFRLKRSASKLSQLSKDDDDDDDSEEEEAEKKNIEEEKEKEKVFKPYKKVSSINLNAVDKNGWTVMHHVVCPLAFGTFDNDEIVFILAKAGAKLNVKTKKGETPLDMAIKTRAFRIARMIQELENISEKNRREPMYTSVKVWDKLKWPNPPPSFHEDAERLLEKLGKPMDVEEEYEAKIDSNCNVTNGTLVKDEDQDLLYDVLLTKVDVNLGVWGLYNFYQIQLVHQAGKDLYILFTRWGRIGDDGQYQHTPYQVKEEAIKEFCKIFRAKTGNKWTEVKSFENKPKRYRLVHNNERRKGHQQTDIEFESKSTVKPKLPAQLQLVMEEMTNVKSLKAALNKEQMDSDIMPFGRIQRDRLLKARTLLEKISVIVNEVEEYRSMSKADKGTEAEEAKLKEKYQQNCEQVAVLSSEYFQVIPQKGFSFEKIRPLDSLKNLKKQISLISNLLDYEVASRMLLGAKYREKDMNPLDYVYQSVGCQMEAMLEDDEESQYILKYVTSSASSTKVEAIYRLEVEGEKARMNKKGLGNHRLLWHGSGVANFLSILHRGLVIAPPEVATTGHLFGKGIYFSDTFSKSAGYCSNLNSESKTLFMLLCEVALGKSKEIISGYLERPEKGYNSVFAIGKNRPVEHHNVRLPTGCLMPLGETKYDSYHNNQYISHYNNEYIVYDEGQVCLRYLIQYRSS